MEPAEEPLPTIEHDELGRLEWSPDDEAWSGRYQGRHFLLAYDRESRPEDELVRYALEVLGDPMWLEDEIKRAQLEATSHDYAEYRGEILCLTLGTVFFYTHRGTRRILAGLDGGLDHRLWRAEFAGRTCEGIGFDD